MKSKLTGLMALVSLVLALSGGAASAVTFDWSTSGPSGSGTFTATYDSGVQYTITAITGTFDGGTITSLIGPGLGLGNNDNLLFAPASALPTGTEQLDILGVAFVAGGQGHTIFSNGSIYLDEFCSGGTSCVDFPTFTASITPLPAALPLFATGIGAMGLLGWRRKRKNAGVIAAA